MLECFPMRFSNPISFIRCTFFAILASRSSSNCDKGVAKELLLIGEVGEDELFDMERFIIIGRLVVVVVVVVVLNDVESSCFSLGFWREKKFNLKNPKL